MRGFDLIHTTNPLNNVVSCLKAPKMNGEVLKTLTLSGIALPNLLIDSVTHAWAKWNFFLECCQQIEILGEARGCSTKTSVIQ